MLTLDRINVQLGSRQILKNISLHVEQGEIVGLIGPNGCGKTTLLNAVSGFVPHTVGEIVVNEQVVTSLPAYTRAKQMGRSFQNSGVFKGMTLAENLIMVIEQEDKFPWYWMMSKNHRDHMDTLVNAALDEVGLLSFKKDKAGVLSGGQLRLLELMRLKLVRRPLLLIDEPTAGVAPVLRNQLSETIRKLAHEHGHTIVLVEHDLKFLFGLVTRVIVLVDGETYMEGKPEEVQQDARLREVYFGK